MDKALVTKSFDNLKIFYKKYSKVIVVFVLLIIVIYATYLYTPKKRITSKIDFITNNLVYKKNRVQIDFCGWQ